MLLEEGEARSRVAIETMGVVKTWAWAFHPFLEVPLFPGPSDLSLEAL